ALQAHDAQVAASGITTVFDALRVGLDEDAEMGVEEMLALAGAIEAGKSGDRLRADHYIHLRCEVSAPDCLESFRHIEDNPLVRLAPRMDHAPGQRQFVNLESYKRYYQGKLKMSDEVLAAFSARRNRESELYAGPQREAIARTCRERSVVL